MRLLWSGTPSERLRLWSGLVLFAFVATHLINHAVGLWSLEAMTRVQHWRLVVTRSPPGFVLLGFAERLPQPLRGAFLGTVQCAGAFLHTLLKLFPVALHGLLLACHTLRRRFGVIGLSGLSRLQASIGRLREHLLELLFVLPLALGEV